ncbi:methyltransferase [Flexivirga endophytica]|uniref:Methyltransferase n=1 Tax=Flexivirga endophytica TaxID=1849103 RepID=A0A916TI42_9MICO|nr:class I SAM-dependent methyltransferase [Flexivirga endophytica]GGB42998.1 methyltransferase [Flexivirga endophytica]GHB64487.1 methyltransferase [Flexivirga endophytica]
MTTSDTTTTEYVFDSPSVQGRQQLNHLQTLLDPITTGVLDDIGVWPGNRCLDLGSGGGSIARWLADRVGPTGQVVAVDLDTEQIDVPSRVQVHGHDIRDGLPVDGPFDLIHARLVLMHLPNREGILRDLVDALAPGGWLVLGETPDRPQEVLAAPTAADAELADRVLRTGLRVVSAAGVALDWAYAVEQRMAAAGLVSIRGNEYSPMVTGSDAGALLMGTYVAQVKPLLLDAGLTEDELFRYHALMRDPRFRAWPFLRLVTTAGRKRAGDAEQTR